MSFRYKNILKTSKMHCIDFGPCTYQSKEDCVWICFSIKSEVAEDLAFIRWLDLRSKFCKTRSIHFDSVGMNNKTKGRTNHRWNVKCCTKPLRLKQSIWLLLSAALDFYLLGSIWNFSKVNECFKNYWNHDCRANFYLRLLNREKVP